VEGEDWRLHGQERYLRGARFQRAEYRAPSATWDHDHCEFCNGKFSEHETGDGVARAGWRSEDEYRWVCDACFADFREPLGFVVFSGESRRGVELHDARVIAITECAGVLTVDLDAFVHDDRDSDSCDGRWQRVALDFHDASPDIHGSTDVDLSDGSVQVNERAYKNMLPIPFHESGAVSAALVGAAFELGVTAQHVCVRLGVATDGRRSSW
jgi:hypothetical protein